MIKNLLLRITGKVIATFPKILMGWYFTRKRLADQIEIEILSRNEPITLDFGQTASVRVHLSVRNFGPLDVELDRIILEVEYKGAHSEVTYQKKLILIGRPKEKQDILMMNDLSERFANTGSVGVETTCTLRIHAEFNSSFGSFHVTRTLERCAPRVLNPRPQK